MRGRGLLSVVFFGAAVLLCAAQPVLARHRAQPQTTDQDPCAAPHAYVSERINQIKALQASAPKNNGSLFDMVEGQKDFDAKRSVEISELRYDADGVNALLAAGGCKAFDLDQELSRAAK